MHDLVSRINETGDRVFYNPSPLLSYHALATGSLANNTYRGFHKIDKTKPGSKEVFDSVFVRNKDDIINNIKQVKREKDLNRFQNDICKKLTDGLRSNIVNSQLNSFNKIRKPVDIFRIF